MTIEQSTQAKELKEQFQALVNRYPQYRRMLESSRIGIGVKKQIFKTQRGFMKDEVILICGNIEYREELTPKGLYITVFTKTLDGLGLVQAKKVRLLD